MTRCLAVIPGAAQFDVMRATTLVFVLPIEKTNLNGAYFEIAKLIGLVFVS